MKIGKPMKLLMIAVLLMSLLAGCSDPYEECQKELIPSECREEKELEMDIFNIFSFVNFFGKAFMSIFD